jgi:hypothetical protein
MERHAYFIQVVPEGQELISSKTLFIQRGDDFFPGGNIFRGRPEDVVLRRERQTFTRLESSDAVLFTVKTRTMRLTELRPEDYKGLAMEIRSWPEEVAKYKGRFFWEDVVLKYCGERSGE